MHPTKIYIVFHTMLMTAIGLSVASYVPNLFRLGLSLADIALINAGFWSMIVLAEIPTGMFADGKSRAWSIRVGALAWALGAVAYGIAEGFWSALACELTAGIANALISGAQQAWLTDALIRRGEGKDLGKAFGTAAIGRSLGMLGGGVAGGVLGSIDLRLPWFVCGAVAFAAYLFACMTFGETGEPVHRVSEGKALRLSVDALRKEPSLRWVVLASMAMGLVLPFNHYWSPFFLQWVDQASIGYVVWIPMYSSLVVGGLLVRRYGVPERREAVGLVSSIFCAGLGLACIGCTGSLAPALFLVAVHEFGRGLFDPIADTFNQRRIESHFRATYGSLHSFLGRFGFAAVLFAIWFLMRDMPTEPTTITLAWTISGLLLCLCALVLWFARPRD